MIATAFTTTAILAFLRAQLAQRPVWGGGQDGAIALIAPPPQSSTELVQQAMETLKQSGEIQGFHLIHTPKADALIVELQPGR